VSIWSVVVVSLASRAVVVCVDWCVSSDVVSLPSRYWSIKFCGMGSMNGGWLLVVGFGRLRSALWGWMSPIWGSSSASALWSPYSGVYVVIFVLWGVYGRVAVG
jgi:hypothetical protein